MDVTCYVVLPLIICAELVVSFALDCENNVGVLEVILRASASSFYRW